jgi:hypothetical protein
VDLRQYFRKIREIEAGLSDQFPVLRSLETPDGGKAGIISEVPRAIAAKMIVEGRAVLASEEERDSYRQQQQDAKAAAEKADLAKQLQVAFLSERNLTSGSSRRPSGISEK